MLLWVNGVNVDDAACTLATKLALGYIGDAAFQGKHIVLAPRPFLRRLASLVDLPVGAREYYRWMAEAFTQYGGLVAQLPHLIIDSEALAPSSVGGQWRVPLSIFENPDFLQTSELICENNNDFEIYSQFAKIYIRRSLPDCNLLVNSRPGGGNTTAQILAISMRDPNPFGLCIVDSDREIVLGKIGSTAEHCLNEYREGWRVKLRVLEARELENIIPRDVIVSVLDNVGVDSSLARVLNDVHDDLALYGCLKSGECPCRFHQINNSYSGFQRTRVAIESTAAAHDGFSRCREHCLECGCKIFPRLGGDFLVRLKAWLAVAANWRKVSQVDCWPSGLRDAIELVVSLGIAFPRRAL